MCHRPRGDGERCVIYVKVETSLRNLCQNLVEVYQRLRIIFNHLIKIHVEVTVNTYQSYHVQTSFLRRGEQIFCFNRPVNGSSGLISFLHQFSNVL